MSAFTKKLNQIKESFASDYGLKKPVTVSNYHSITAKKIQPPTGINRVKSLSRCDIKVSSPECKNQNYIIRQPVIIQTKNSKKKSYSTSEDVSRKYSSVRKNVEPFVPLIIPTRDRSHVKQEMQSLQTNESSRKNHEIEIYIEKDQKDSKQCLQKLFKKIHTLQQQLATSQKQRHKLQIQVQHLRKRNKQCADHDKIINKLQGDKYKLQMEVSVLKKQLKDENRRMPKQTVRQIIVEKPVQVRVEVPKYIPGPERIVEKIVQKIVEVERKVPFEVKLTSPPEVIEKPVYIHVDKPVYVDKPIYIDKPIYVNNPVQKIVQRKVQVPYEVPFQVPVYIDRPVVDEEWMMRLHGIEQELGMVLQESHEFKSDNHRLRVDNQTLRSTIDQLGMNMQMLQQHNEQKNREVEYLLRNGQDYVPVCTQSRTTRDNSSSSRQTNYMTSPRSKRYY